MMKNINLPKMVGVYRTVLDLISNQTLAGPSYWPLTVIHSGKKPSYFWAAAETECVLGWAVGGVSNFLRRDGGRVTGG